MGWADEDSVRKEVLDRGILTAEEMLDVLEQGDAVVLGAEDTLRGIVLQFILLSDKTSLSLPRILPCLRCRQLPKVLMRFLHPLREGE